MKQLFLSPAAAQAHAQPKPLVNVAELNHYLTAFRRAFRPGLCPRIIRASIVAAGSLAGMDLRQEDAYAGPHLEATASRFAAEETISQLA